MDRVRRHTYNGAFGDESSVDGEAAFEDFAWEKGGDWRGEAESFVYDCSEVGEGDEFRWSQVLYLMARLHAWLNKREGSTIVSCH